MIHLYIRGFVKITNNPHLFTNKFGDLLWKSYRLTSEFMFLLLSWRLIPLFVYSWEIFYKLSTVFVAWQDCPMCTCQFSNVNK